MTDMTTRQARIAAINAWGFRAATVLWAASAVGWLMTGAILDDDSLAILAVAGAVTTALAAWIWQRHGPGWQAMLPMIPSAVAMAVFWIAWT